MNTVRVGALVDSGLSRSSGQMSVEMRDEKRDQQDGDRREMVHSRRIFEAFEYRKKGTITKVVRLLALIE